MMGAMAVTFWDRFFDSEYRQRTDIGALQDLENQTAADLGSHDARIGRLEKQLHELQMTLAALMKVMSEMGQLDPRAVKMRVEAELEAMLPPAPAKPAVHARPVKERPPDVPVTCARCGATVPSSRKTITEAGTLCDKCAP